MVTFDFAALDFASPEHNRYRYKLEGFDQDWVDGGTKRSVTATLTSQAATAQAVTVKAANSDGIWNDTGLSLPLEVAAPALGYRLGPRRLRARCGLSALRCVAEPAAKAAP